MAKKAKNTLAAEIGATPKQIARELRMFSRAAKVLSSKHPRLIDSHPREWVGIYDGHVCASAESLDALMAGLKKKGLPASDTIIRYIDTSGRKLIL